MNINNLAYYIVGILVGLINSIILNIDIFQGIINLLVMSCLIILNLSIYFLLEKLREKNERKS